MGNAFSTGLLLDIVKTRQYLSSSTTSIQIHNSFFGANKNMKSVMILYVNIPANITNCVFIDNSGDSVASVSTTDQLLFNNVTFTNNNMTAVEVWNGALIHWHQQDTKQPRNWSTLSPRVILHQH